MMRLILLYTEMDAGVYGYIKTSKDLYESKLEMAMNKLCKVGETYQQIV